jgi:hypothetical protein
MKDHGRDLGTRATSGAGTRLETAAKHDALIAPEEGARLRPFHVVLRSLASLSGGEQGADRLGACRRNGKPDHSTSAASDLRAILAVRRNEMALKLRRAWGGRPTVLSDHDFSDRLLGGRARRESSLRAAVRKAPARTAKEAKNAKEATRPASAHSLCSPPSLSSHPPQPIASHTSAGRPAVSFRLRRARPVASSRLRAAASSAAERCRPKVACKPVSVSVPRVRSASRMTSAT